MNVARRAVGIAVSKLEGKVCQHRVPYQLPMQYNAINVCSGKA